LTQAFQLIRTGVVGTGDDAQARGREPSPPAA
jgi:hypothetical protein